MVKKILFSKEDYFKQLDKMLEMPSIGEPTPPGTLLDRLRTVARKSIKNKIGIPEREL